MSRHRMLGLMLVFAVAGCASMSADECRTADWRVVGFEDGRDGSAGRLSDHRKACAKVGVTPDLDRYEEGRAEGLQQYCVPHRGYEVGSRGGRYQGVCPADLEGAFLEAYEDGRVLYGLEQAVDRIESSIRGAERDLENDEDAIRDLEQQLIDDPGTADNRRRLLEDIKERTRNAEAHRIELVELHHELRIAERDLDDYRALQADGYR